MSNKLSHSFYRSNNILQSAQDLLGKVLCSSINDKFTSGKIVEVEAYLGPNDRASHSYNNKKTQRTAPMFASGGISYVYLCYGIHHLFNVVVGEKNNPCAILIRGLEPVDGVNIMLKRRNLNNSKNELTNGPGKLTQALGITSQINTKSLLGNEIWIEDHKFPIIKKDILSSSRIGVDYAGRDAKLPYRFYINNNKWVSKT